MEIMLAGVQPYDGRYQLTFADELTTREWGWIKRLAGYLPTSLDEAAAGGDPEFACVLAVIALRRSGKIDQVDVPQVFDRLIDAPFGSAITLNFDDELVEEGDAGPPALSSNGSENTSGDDSRPSSEMSTANPPASGTPGSGSSASGPLTSVT